MLGTLVAGNKADADAKDQIQIFSIMSWEVKMSTVLIMNFFAPFYFFLCLTKYIPAPASPALSG